MGNGEYTLGFLSSTSPGIQNPTADSRKPRAAREHKRLTGLKRVLTINGPRRHMSRTCIASDLLRYLGPSSDPRTRSETTLPPQGAIVLKYHSWQFLAHSSHSHDSEETTIELSLFASRSGAPVKSTEGRGGHEGEEEGESRIGEAEHRSVDRKRW
ncbi:hypothetical protein BHE74_00058752 [Ensete ventricosum]|nr:hypothetical protein BHE74_00058752 [Ensete ventricosum]